MSGASQNLRTIWSLLWAPIWLLILHPYWRLRSRGQSTTWVIGGHRGRLYGDNSAAVEAEARRQGQATTWIANPPLARELRARGIDALERQSFQARRAISSANALIYSHGEDDLDLLLLLLRGFTAPRIYLNHCLNLLKAGGVHEPGWWQQSALVRYLRTKLITDCDVFLYASEAEHNFFKLSYPMHSARFRPGGGAHLDAVSAHTRAPKRRIYWFPTFRESETENARLRDTIVSITQNERLTTWLEENDYEFLIGSHVNSGEKNALSLRPPFVQADLGRLIEDLGETEVFISDYSSVSFDFLFSGRPPILFTFDLADFSRRRFLYQDINSLDYALVTQTEEELVDALIERAFAAEPLLHAAHEARDRLLPSGTGHAARSVSAIYAVLAEQNSVRSSLTTSERTSPKLPARASLAPLTSEVSHRQA